MTKFCKECKRKLEEEKFYTRPDGFTLKICKDCRNDYRNEWRNKFKVIDPITHKIVVMIDNAIGRVRKGGEKGYESYKNVEFKFSTRKEALDYIKNNFLSDIEKLISEGKIPSIDRIDSKGHYEIGNIRFIDRDDNSRLGQKNSLEKSRKKVLVCAEGWERVYESISDTSRKLSIPVSTISHRLRGRKPRKDDGYIFQYWEEK